MKYRVVFHIRKQPEGRITPIKVDMSKMDYIAATQYGIWVDENYHQAFDDVGVYLLPPHKIEYIERIEDE